MCVCVCVCFVRACVYLWVYAREHVSGLVLQFGMCYNGLVYVCVWFIKISRLIEDISDWFENVNFLLVVVLLLKDKSRA